MVPGCKEWDVKLLQELFVERDVIEIPDIPLSRALVDDIKVWHFTKDGIYSIKSGYKVLFTQDVIVYPRGLGCVIRELWCIVRVLCVKRTWKICGIYLLHALMPVDVGKKLSWILL
ncbi:hypothetical protein DITRI_Ditri03aG0108300 [Diplodiscus trichospermus]